MAKKVKKTKKKPGTCRCGAPLYITRHGYPSRCTQTGQLSENCNQVPLETPEPEPDEVAE